MAANPLPNSQTFDADGRKDLLLHMYDQMFSDINRHILVIWQSVGVLLGAFALLALVEKDIVPIDVAISLIVLLSAWLIAHVYDASYWYNRNLVIIANIERQFLRPEDQRHIHYYFGSHRAINKMMMHLRIQYLLGLGIAAIVVLYHAATRVWEGVDLLWTERPDVFEALAEFDANDAARALPYVALVASFFVARWVRSNRNESYQNFLTNSPGAEIDTTGITYGSGHPGLRRVPEQAPPK